MFGAVAGVRKGVSAVIMIKGGAACNKMSPAVALAPVKDTLSADNSKTVKTSEEEDCFRHGRELATSGTFNFPIDSSVTNSAELVSLLGSMMFGFYDVPLSIRSYLHPMDTECNFNVKIYQYNFLVSANVYDLHGDLVFQVNDNKWRIFRDDVRKYNYDAKGFEVYDKSDQIVMSIDFRPILGEPAVVVQAVLPCTASILGYYPSTNFLSNIPYGTPALNRAFDHLYDSIPIQPMFRYTGKDWQHSRL